MPLRVNCGRDERVSTVLASVEKALRRREEFETSSLADIGDWSPLDGGESLFDTLVVLENYPLEDMLKKRMGTLTLESYDMVEMPHYDLTLGIRVGDCIAIDYIYDAAALERDTLGALAGHFRCMLENILANPEQGWGKLKSFRRVRNSGCWWILTLILTLILMLALTLGLTLVLTRVLMLPRTFRLPVRAVNGLT